MTHEAECIDCGQWSEALLPARFPHICRECLFPAVQGTMVTDLYARIPRPQTTSERGWRDGD